MSTITTPRIYAACLASYNNGVLHGAWIDATTDVDAMQADINAMLRTSRFPNVMRQDYLDSYGDLHHVDVPAASPAPDDWTAQGKPYATAEEWAIHDSEGHGAIGEYAGLEEVEKRVAIVEVAEERDIPPAVLIEAMSDMGATDADEFVGDQYDGSASTWAEFAERSIEETDSEMLDNLPTWLSCHIDWEGVGRDWELGGDWSAYRDGDGDMYFFRNN